MRKTLLLFLLALILGSVTGCRSLRKGLTQHFYSSGPLNQSHGNWSASKRYVLTDSRLRSIPFEGVVEIEDANVSYQHSLEEQARCIANQIGDLTSHIEDTTGLKIRYGARVYLMRRDQIPENYQMSFKNEPNTFTMPLFVLAGEESCEAIVAQNVAYPGIFMHELVEMSLTLHKAPGAVLGDVEGRLPLFKPRLLNYTRWFREGFADYAGILADQVIPPETLPAYPTIDVAGSSRPFSALSKVGTKLFKWHQYSRASLNNDYYDAALGLFLLITDRFGPDALKNVVARINEQDYLDGRDLINTANDTLNTDLRQLASDFRFPDTGLKLSALTKAKALNEDLKVAQGLFVQAVEPNSPADNAGIKKKDVILKIADESVRSNLEFERTVFELLGRQRINVALWRKDKGQMSIELPLIRPLRQSPPQERK